MLKNHWVKRILLAGVWTMAASTWASIGHYLGGLPDVGPILPAGVAVMILAWPRVTPAVIGRVFVGRPKATGQPFRS